MKRSSLIFASAAIFAAVSLPSCAAGTAGSPRSATAAGSGSVSVIPDTAHIQLSVVTRKNSVTEATAENARRMADVQQAILDAGIPKESWSTSNYTVYQESAYVNGRSVPGDYRVSNMLTVVIKDVTKAGSVIDAAIAAGANELTSLSFSASDTSDAEDQARVLAVEQARHAAEILAETGGARLGKLLSISEESYSQPALQSNRLLSAEYAAGGTPVTAGKSAITVTVRATFALR